MPAQVSSFTESRSQPYTSLTRYDRKQKCGGFTHDIKCRPCTTRRVKCSFQDEVMDLRHNPYLRMNSPTSETAGAERSAIGNFAVSSSSAALIPALSVLDEGDSATSLPASRVGESLPMHNELPRQLQSLTERCGSSSPVCFN